MQIRTVRSLLAVCAVAAALAGCSAGPLTDTLKQVPESLGGLPPDVPKAPAMPYQYPAVHDMPPPRPSEPMSEEQQYRLEKELNALRERQEGALGKGRDDAAGAKKPPKKRPAAAQTDRNTGAETNP
jgi:hypothetical protein